MTHPGKFLYSELMKHNWTCMELSRIGLNYEYWIDLLNCRKSITPEAAELLAATFEKPAKFWLDLQDAWDKRQTSLVTEDLAYVDRKQN